MYLRGHNKIKNLHFRCINYVPEFWLLPENWKKQTHIKNILSFLHNL